MASNWDTAQTVTVQAETATLTHTAAGGDYTGMAEKTLAVSVTDPAAGWC